MINKNDFSVIGNEVVKRKCARFSMTEGKGRESNELRIAFDRRDSKILVDREEDS